VKLKITPKVVWDIVESRQKRGIEIPSVQVLYFDESSWFRQAFGLMRTVAKYHKRTLTENLWKELYSFSVNFIKTDSKNKETLTRARERTNEFEWTTARPYLVVRKDFKSSLAKSDWLIGIRREGLQKKFKTKIDYLDRYIAVMVMEVLKIYGWETKDRSLYELSSKKFIKEIQARVALEAIGAKL